MLQKYLTKPSLLWVLFGIVITISFAFEPIKNHWNLILLDQLSSPIDVRAALNQMNLEQRTAHVWFTATLDVVFPITLGGFLAGIALVSFERCGKYLAILPLAGIPLDIVEGIIQILALTNTYYLLELKAIVTPLKMALFTAGLAVALLAGVKWLALKFKKSVNT